MADTVAAPRELLREILDDGTCPLHVRMQLQRLLGVVPVTVPVAAVPPAARREDAPPPEAEAAEEAAAAGDLPAALAAAEAALAALGELAAAEEAAEGLRQEEAPLGELAAAEEAAEGLRQEEAPQGEAVAAEELPAPGPAVEERPRQEDAPWDEPVMEELDEATAAAPDEGAEGEDAEEFFEAAEASEASEASEAEAIEEEQRLPPEEAVDAESEGAVDAVEFFEALAAQEADEAREAEAREEEQKTFHKREREYLQAVGACTKQAGAEGITDWIGPMLPLVAARLPLAEILAIRACSSAGLEWAMERRTQRLGGLAKVHDRIRSRLWIQRLFAVNQGSADETLYETKVRSLADDAQRRRMEAEMAEARRDMEVQIRDFQQEVDRRMDLQAERVHAIVEERVQHQLDAILHAEMEKVRTMVEDHVQGRVRAVVQREVHAAVCEMQVRLARLARENDRLRAAFLEQLDHSNLCLRFLVWARSSSTTAGLLARTLWAARRRLGAWLLGVPSDRRRDGFRSRLEAFRFAAGDDEDGAAAAAGDMSRSAGAALRSSGAAGEEEDSPLDAMTAIAMLCAIAVPRAQQALQQHEQPPGEGEGPPALVESGSEEAEAGTGAGEAVRPSPPAAPSAPPAAAMESEAEGGDGSGASQPRAGQDVPEMNVSMPNETGAPDEAGGSGEGVEGHAPEDNAEGASDASGFGLVEPSDDEEEEELLRQAVQLPEVEPAASDDELPEVEPAVGRRRRQPSDDEEEEGERPVASDDELPEVEPAAAAAPIPEAVEPVGQGSAEYSHDQADAASEGDQEFQDAQED